MDDDQILNPEPHGALRTTQTAGGGLAVHNERGVIAENYHDLQGLGLLAAARAAYPLPKASAASTLRAVFQAVDLALLNLADIVGRAAADLESGAVGPATVKARWAHGFHRVLVALSMLPQQLGLGESSARAAVLSVGDSPALHEYLGALSVFDRATLADIDAGRLTARASIADRSLDDPLFNLLHFARVSSHESTIWEHNLLEVRIPVEVPSYEEFVTSSVLREAVYERVLKGDTYFTQFRGLHQIPETLGDEANDHTEQAIRDLREGRLPAAIEHLRLVNILVKGMLSALAPMADNLATSDYHQIRENLGLTSGSHSVCLRFHMFTDLYRQLWEEVARQLPGRLSTSAADESVDELIQAVVDARSEDASSWIRYDLLNQCLGLRAFVFQWRDQHLHMPRNNLGGAATKSLTGSPDAVTAVVRMRNAARVADPMLALARVRGVGMPAPGHAGALANYIASPDSLDTRLLEMTGHITQSRFHDVQERLGFFANRCAFVPPPPRQV